MSSRALRWVTLLLLLAALLPPAPPAAAQASSTLSVQDRAVVEGNDDTTNLVIAITVSPVTNQTISGLLSTRSGGATLNATGSASCGGGVDFVTVFNQPFTISPFTSSTTVKLTVCGDILDEMDERFEVFLTDVANAQCLQGTCDAIVRIRDDEPLLTISSLGDVEEGNTGRTLAGFAVDVLGPRFLGLSVPFRSLAVTAIPGDTCATAGVDFIRAVGTLTFNSGEGRRTIAVSVCGDTRDEPTEILAVELSDGDGFELSDGVARAPTNIIDDDPSPVLTIADASATEGQPCSGTELCAPFTILAFTASLSAVSELTATVDFATGNGTASGGSGPGCSADFRHNSGMLTFAPLETSKTFGVAVCKDASFEPNEVFFVTLSNPVNATCTGGDCSAVGTIVNDDSTTGTFALQPETATVETGQHVLYTLVWTVPPPQVWRNLRTIDFRVADNGESAIWVRWDEATDTLALCEAASGKPADGRCGGGQAPGGAGVLQTARARLHLAESSVRGSGPTGRDVTLRLGLSFKGGAVGRTYELRVAAADDRGNRDETFLPAGSVQVVKGKD